MKTEQERRLIEEIIDGFNKALLFGEHNCTLEYKPRWEIVELHSNNSTARMSVYGDSPSAAFNDIFCFLDDRLGII